MPRSATSKSNAPPGSVTSPGTGTPPATYREAYAALSRIAAELENGEADLDRVLPLIQEAQAAYEVCRARIEALRAALGEDAEVDDEDDTDEDHTDEDEGD